MSAVVGKELLAYDQSRLSGVVTDGCRRSRGRDWLGQLGLTNERLTYCDADSHVQQANYQSVI